MGIRVKTESSVDRFNVLGMLLDVILINVLCVVALYVVSNP